MDVTSGRDFLNHLAYLARITTRDGRAIEEAMAGTNLLDNGARLDGAVVEASYAFDRPPLLKRLGDDKVPRIIDPQTLRFVGENFLEIERLRRLPYAPAQPIAAASFDAKAARTLSRDALTYAQDRGADLHLAPALPLFDKDLDLWRRLNAALLAAACAANGGSELDRRPLIAQVAPGNKALADPAALVDVLVDHPVDGVYVQALRFQPTADSLEKLARFVQFVRALHDAGFPVIIGRVGAFGLVLQGLGVRAFDSGLGQAESHDLPSLNRRPTDRERARRARDGGGGPARRVYLQELMTTLPADAADAILRAEKLRHHFTCSLGCCRFRALEELSSRARIHYLYVRRAEVDRVAALPLPALRLHELETQLRQAADLGSRLRRALPKAGSQTSAIWSAGCGCSRVNKTLRPRHSVDLAASPLLGQRHGGPRLRAALATSPHLDPTAPPPQPVRPSPMQGLRPG